MKTTAAEPSVATATARSGCASWPPFAFAMCGGLAVLYLFFVVIGTIDVGDAAVATLTAIVLALIWLFSFWRRMRTDAVVRQRPDRERRGF